MTNYSYCNPKIKHSIAIVDDFASADQRKIGYLHQSSTTSWFSLCQLQVPRRRTENIYVDKVSL